MSSFLNTYLNLFSTPLVRKGPSAKQPVEMASSPTTTRTTSNFGGSQSVSERRGSLFPPASSSSSSSPNGSRLDLSISPAPSSMWSSTPPSPNSKSGKKKTLYSLNTPVSAHDLSFEDWGKMKKQTAQN